jgi:hypothetical protein
VPSTLFQHVLALQSLEAAQAQEKNPKGKGKYRVNNKKNQQILCKNDNWRKKLTIPDIWHMIASSWQKPLAALSCTFREKLIHAQLLTLPPLTIFYPEKEDRQRRIDKKVMTHEIIKSINKKGACRQKASKT